MVTEEERQIVEDLEFWSAQQAKCNKMRTRNHRMAIWGAVMAVTSLFIGPGWSKLWGLLSLTSAVVNVWAAKRVGEAAAMSQRNVHRAEISLQRIKAARWN